MAFNRRRLITRLAIGIVTIASWGQTFGAGAVSGNSPVPDLVSTGDNGAVVFDILRTGNSDLLHHNFAQDQTVTLMSQAKSPAVNSDGGLIAFQTAAIGTQPDVKLFNVGDNTTRLLSRAIGTTQPANGKSFHPLITSDGNFVFFRSEASNIVQEAANSAIDLFLHDVKQDKTTLISRSIRTVQSADDASFPVVIAADNRTVVFTSFASDLVPGDFNQGADIFIMRLPGPESDFRITTISRVSTGEVTLFWSARTGVTYRIEIKEEITAQWQRLDAAIQINGAEASARDASAGLSRVRFYRLVEIPQ
jgi:hypothetical protein